MLNFSYRNPVKVVFGTGTLAALAREVPATARVLVTYGGGSVKATGTLAEVLAALAGRHVVEFGGIEPNPSYETMMRALDVVRAEGIDYLVAVGGGSVMDGSKFLAAAARHDGDAMDILTSRGRCVKDALPLGVVVTLAATGSETNNGGVLTHLATHAKTAFSSPLLFPRFAIMDPAKTLTLPVRQVGNGVVDAFVHVVEQYLTYPVDGRIQDRYAEGILLTLIEEGPRALAEPGNVDVRANLMWAASQALNGLIGAGVPQDWATHMLGHELTAAHGLDHAQTLAIVLPAMLQERRAQKRDKLLQYAGRVWGLRDGSEEARIDAAIAATRDFFERMNVPTRLSAYGITAEAIPHLVAQLEAHGMTQLGERRDITPDISRRVLEACL